MIIIPRKFSFEDIQQRVNWINNPLIHETMFFELPASIASTEKWFKSNENSIIRKDFTFRNEQGLVVAMGGFTGISMVHNNAEFYVMVNPLMQRQGIGQNVSKWMYNYAFSVLKLHKIFLYTNDKNVAAYKIYEKAGFILEGVLREQKFKNGVFQNRRFYGLLRSEWMHMDWKNDITNEV